MDFPFPARHVWLPEGSHDCAIPLEASTAREAELELRLGARSAKLVYTWHDPTFHDWLVVTGTWLLFFHILGKIIKIDVHIFQRGWNHQPDLQTVSGCHFFFPDFEGFWGWFPTPFMRRLLRPGCEVKMGVPPNWPMILVSWYGANAYALWAARLLSHRRTGTQNDPNIWESDWILTDNYMF